MARLILSNYFRNLIVCVYIYIISNIHLQRYSRKYIRSNWNYFSSTFILFRKRIRGTFESGRSQNSRCAIVPTPVVPPARERIVSRARTDPLVDLLRHNRSLHDTETWQTSSREMLRTAFQGSVPSIKSGFRYSIPRNTSSLPDPSFSPLSSPRLFLPRISFFNKHDLSRLKFPLSQGTFPRWISTAKLFFFFFLEKRIN